MSKVDAQGAGPIRVEEQYRLEQTETVTVTTSSQTLDELLTTDLTDASDKVLVNNIGGATVYLARGTATTSSGGLADGQAIMLDGPDLSAIELIAAANTDVSLFVYQRMGGC